MDDFEEVVAHIIAIFVLVVIVCILLGISSCSDTKSWNNGYCECGGKWKYQQAVGHRYSTSYLYKCDKCGEMIEIDDYKKP